MNQPFAKLIHQDPFTKARILEINTEHGSFQTPVFMAVATYAALNCLTIEDAKKNGSKIILGGNTFHMLNRPGSEVIQDSGGMHRFMNWSRPMLTDSGGFQVFSLGNRDGKAKITEDGVTFPDFISGEKIFFNSAKSISMQKIIGADIIMAFDQCCREDADREEARKIMKRTHCWLEDSIAYHQKETKSIYGDQQALFGIIQGGFYRELREESSKFVSNSPIDGIALGGEAIGFDMKKTLTIIEWIRDILPPSKPRYAMGVGLRPQDLLDAVSAGIDMFDCVAPTRNARHGALYHGQFKKTNDNWITFTDSDKGRILIKKNCYKNDQQPILEDCQCSTCRDYSRAYLHHLFRSNHPLYLVLASNHNIFIMNRACQEMHRLILSRSEPRQS